MSLLAIEPGIPASRICHVIGFDKGPVSRTLSVLQKRGLVTIRTAPDDGRTHAISLTAEGRATHDKVIVAALERERRLLSCLQKDEREVLIDLLRRRPRQSRCREGRRQSRTTKLERSAAVARKEPLGCAHPFVS